MRSTLLLAAVVISMAFQAALPGAQRGAEPGDWRHHGGDAGSTKYSALDQITADNVSSLQVVWRRPGADPAILAANPNLVVPAQLPRHAAQGRQPPVRVGRARHRAGARSGHRPPGVDAGGGARRYRPAPAPAATSPTGTARAAPACSTCAAASCTPSTRATGHVVEGFGQRGRVDLLAGLGDKATVVPLGRARPARRRATSSSSAARAGPTAARRWIFRPATCAATTCAPARCAGPSTSCRARASPAIETWEHESWKDTGSAKAWSLMSADEELGYVYVPLSSAANEWYGGQRPGDESLLRQPGLPRRRGPASASGTSRWCTTTSGTTTTPRRRCSPTSP